MESGKSKIKVSEESPVSISKMVPYYRVLWRRGKLSSHGARDRKATKFPLSSPFIRALIHS
jgi:hypothetical protein